METVSVVMQGGVTMKSFPTGAPPSTCEAEEEALETMSPGLWQSQLQGDKLREWRRARGVVTEHFRGLQGSSQGPFHCATEQRKGDHIQVDEFYPSFDLASHGKLTWHVGWFYVNLT